MVANTFPLFTNVPSKTKISLTVPPIKVEMFALFCGGTVVYPLAFITKLRFLFSTEPVSIPTVLYYYNQIFWETLTITVADIGTTYQNVSILLTQHNDGVQPMNAALKKNPVHDLDSVNFT